MKRAISTTCVLLAFVALPGVGQATTITFDSLSVGDYDNGDKLFNDGTLQVSIATASAGDPN